MTTCNDITNRLKNNNSCIRDDIVSLHDILINTIFQKSHLISNKNNDQDGKSLITKALNNDIFLATIEHNVLTRNHIIPL